MKTKVLEEAKKHFEANMLDGTRVEESGGSMINAIFIWEYIEETLTKHTEEVLKDLLPEKKSTIANMLQEDELYLQSGADGIKGFNYYRQQIKDKAKERYNINLK